jgi:dTDP-glucose 4,6-dehydratase
MFAHKVREELGCYPQESFERALRRTIDWYLANEGWWAPLRAVTTQRLGLVG